MPPQQDYFGRMGLWPYDTRIRPMPVPEAGIFDAPTMSICINVKWAAHIDGLLERLLWFDAWSGTQDDKERAVANITALMVSMAERNPCGDDMSCTDVADCIENDESVRHQIARMVDHDQEMIDNILDMLRDHPGGDTNPKDQPIPSNTRITITQPDTCDNDVLWSQCVGVVSTAHVMIGQFMTVWSAYATEGNVVAAIVGNVPLLGPVAYSLGLAGVQGYAALIISSIGALYSAAATDDYREQLACALFCAAQDDCYVTISMAQNILNTRIGGLLSLISTTDIMTSLINLDLTGLNVADVYMAAFFDLVGQGNLVWPINWGIDSFLASVATYNTPSNGWTTICDDCPLPVLDCYDFTIDAQGWAPSDPTSAQYIDGSGFGQENNTYLTILDQPEDTVREWTSIYIKLNRPLTGVNDFEKCFFLISNTGGSNVQGFGTGAGPLLYGQEFTLTSTGDPWIRPVVQMACGGYTFLADVTIQMICRNPA